MSTNYNDYVLIAELIRGHSGSTAKAWEMAETAKENAKDLDGIEIYPAISLHSNYTNPDNRPAIFVRIKAEDDKIAREISHKILNGINGIYIYIKPIKKEWYSMTIFDKNLYEVKDEWTRLNMRSKANLESMSYFSSFMYESGNTVRLIGIRKPRQITEMVHRNFLTLLANFFNNSELIYNK